MDWLLGLTNAYDVMGLAPDATQQEIEAQYDLLVTRKGYRIGMRRSSWRQRLAEIKSAHATLSDPAKRQAYDRSLGLVSAAPPKRPWAFGAAPDTSTDSLVRPAAILRAPGAGANGPKGGGKRALKTNGLPLAAAMGATASSAASRPSATDQSPPSRVTQQTDTPEASEPQQRAEQFEPTREEDLRRETQVNAWSAVRRGSVKSMAIAGALALGLSALLFASWQQGSSGPAVDRTRSPASAEQIRVTNGAKQPAPSATFAGLDTSSKLSPEEQAAAAADEGAASASLSQWLGEQGAKVAGIVAPSTAGNPPAGANPQLPVGAPANGQVEQAPAAVARVESPAQTAPQAAGPVTAAVSPAVTLPRPNPSSAVPVRPTVDLSKPSTWVSGGPGASDNRRGRYRGSLDAQLTIGADGRVSNCSVVRTSGNSELDALTCRIVQERARFTPAQDAQGRAVSSRANATYVWGRGRRSKK